MAARRLRVTESHLRAASAREGAGCGARPAAAAAR
eukprot:gene431-3580_t